MSINAIGPSYQNQRPMPTTSVGTEQEKPNGSTEINQLKAEIEQAEAEMKETAKEVQKAVGESIGGSSEKVQMLQNKVQMQQQTILMKQMEIKEMEAPSKAATEQTSVSGIKDGHPRFDEYVKNDKVVSGAGIYSVERDENGNPVVVFENPEKPSQESPDPAKPPAEGEKPEIVKSKSSAEDEKPVIEKCTVNTDRVDAEIKKLKEQLQTIQKQLSQAENAEEQEALKKQLTTIEAELRAKDNDAYRKQNATYTYSKGS